MTDAPELGPWECFRDDSYYNMWCVRRVHDRKFGQGFHLVQGDEAAALRDLLNTRAPTVDAHKPTPTSVDDSAAVNTIDNGDLVEAVARTLFDDLEQYGPDPSSWGDICILEKLPWKRSAQAALDTAAPLIRAQIADNLDAMKREDTNWPQVIARMIREGEV